MFKNSKFKISAEGRSASGGKNTNQQKLKIFVGLSGGVDSAVAVALLKKQGYDVVGVFIKTWQPDWLECTWPEERRDAMRVAAHLEIPFLTFNFEKEYKEQVADYMIEGYKKGTTPNPDVMCNKQIKFGSFLKKAREMGADAIATGHYARLCRKDTNSKKQDTNKFQIPNSKLGTTNCQLLTGRDGAKDQSYFLWTLAQEQLKSVLFPIGGLEKSEVRNLAKKFKLPVSEKKDSQGICFLGKVDIKEFLKNYLKTKEGNVLNENGKVIGRHEGSVLYTIGQRHGFIVTDKGTDDKPLFVVNKNLEDNTITVSERKPDQIEEKERKEIEIGDINWINQLPEINGRYCVRVRYRQQLQTCRVVFSEAIGSQKNAELTRNNAEKIKIIFDDPQAATPGQSLVLYDGDVCLGGGIIK